MMMVEHDVRKCRELLGSISDYIDGILEEELCLELERHIAECKNCHIVVDTLQKTIYLYQKTSDQAAVPAEVRQRLFRSLNLENYLNR